MRALLLLFLFLSGCSKWELKWQEEFNGNALDTNKWEYYDSNQRRHDAYHDKKGIEVSDGTLKVKVITENNIHYTAIPRTIEKFGYGYYEARVRFDVKSGQWADGWMTSQEMLDDKDIGIEKQEIDWWEVRAKDEKDFDISDSIYYNIHRFSYLPGKHGWDGKFVTGLNINDNKFHILGFLRTPKKYVFFVDGLETWRTDKVTSQKLPFLFSCEVADKFWAGDIPEGGYNGVPMEIDYIRVWEKN